MWSEDELDNFPSTLTLVIVQAFYAALRYRTGLPVFCVCIFCVCVLSTANTKTTTIIIIVFINIIAS